MVNPKWAGLFGGSRSRGGLNQDAFETWIFQKIFFTTPIFFRQAILNTKKLIYIEVWYSLVRPAEDGKLPNTARLDSTPPRPI